MNASLVLSLGLTAILLTASAFDIRSFRIPNVISFSVMGLFLIRAVTVTEFSVLPSHIAAFALTSALGFFAFSARCLGGGDVKLIAVLALWFGMTTLSNFIVMTAVAGGVIAITLSAMRYLIASRTLPSRSGLRLLDREAPVPYALPIAFAALSLEWNFF